MALTRIRTQIQAAKVETHDSSCPTFMPEGSLSSIATYESLVEVLTCPEFSVPRHKRENTARFIVQEPAQKLFAILIETKCEKYLTSLLENDYSDRHLPIDQSSLKILLEDSADLFARMQHEYLVYSFRRGQFHRKLRDFQVLPFLHQERIGGGGFSSVYKALVHPLHQDFEASTGSQAVPVVRKQLNTSQKSGKAEAELLYLLGSLRHRNIVEILTSYVHRGVPNLLFVPAEMDLHQFLSLSKRPSAFLQNHVFLRAIEGLSGGLAYIHNFTYYSSETEDEPTVLTGYHHDIKPRNILVRGTDLVLADFGLSKLKDLENDTKTPWKDTTYEYGPPECRDPESFEPRLVGRALDIWSLGCIISEIVAYAEGGPVYVETFRQNRIQQSNYGTMRCFHDGEKLCAAVSSFLSDMAKEQPFSSLIELIRRTFSTVPGDRPTADEMKFLLLRYAVEDLVNGMLSMISSTAQNPEPSPNHHLHRTRLSIEMNRLLAWAKTLGFRTGLGRDEETHYNRQFDSLKSRFYEILVSVSDALSANDRFPDPLDTENYKLQSLRTGIDELCDHLPNETKLSIDDNFHIITLAKAPTSAFPLLIGSSAATGQDSNFGKVAAMKYVSILLREGRLKASRPFRIESSLMRAYPQIADGILRPHLWLYAYGHNIGEEKKVIVDFVQYWWPEMEERKADFELLVGSMLERCGGIVEMLRQDPKPDAFLTLDCLGAFHDENNQRWGLVYDFPDQAGLPVCLSSVLRQGKSYLTYPGINERFTLAKRLVSCIHSCHSAGWIHKSISSASVIFFVVGSDWSDMSIDQPYLIGFDHSRPDGEDSPSSKTPRGPHWTHEYCHPEYREGSTGAKISHDYYSLGLVLLEIGTWTSISDVYNDRRNRTLTSWQLRDKYIARCERELHKAMGPLYQAVTLSCLKNVDFAEEEPLEEILCFKANVVDKINAIKLS